MYQHHNRQVVLLGNHLDNHPVSQLGVRRLFQLRYLLCSHLQFPRKHRLVSLRNIQLLNRRVIQVVTPLLNHLEGQLQVQLISHRDSLLGARLVAHRRCHQVFPPSNHPVYRADNLPGNLLLTLLRTQVLVQQAFRRSHRQVFPVSNPLEAPLCSHLDNRVVYQQAYRQSTRRHSQQSSPQCNPLAVQPQHQLHNQVIVLLISPRDIHLVLHPVNQVLCLPVYHPGCRRAAQLRYHLRNRR